MPSSNELAHKAPSTDGPASSLIQQCTHCSNQSHLQSLLTQAVFLPSFKHQQQQQSRFSLLSLTVTRIILVLTIIIHRACFKMLNNSVPEEFKVSNNPTLTGWNATMSILDILNQLNMLYRHHEPMTLIQNNALFCLPFRATHAPERFFWCIEQCQEFQVMAGNPYSNMQQMTNTVQVLVALCIFPMHKLEDWEAMAIKFKSYMILKIFIHAVYAHLLVAMQICTLVH